MKNETIISERDQKLLFAQENESNVIYESQNLENYTRIEFVSTIALSLTQKFSLNANSK